MITKDIITKLKEKSSSVNYMELFAIVCNDYNKNPLKVLDSLKDVSLHEYYYSKEKSFPEIKEEDLLKYKLKKSNANATTIRNGSIFQSINAGLFRVIGILDEPYLDKKGKIVSYNKVLIQFLDGTVIITEKASIRKGTLINPNTPSVCGVGCIGVGIYHTSYNGVALPEYNLWENMITRCYVANKDNNRYRCYKNVTVDPHWHNYQNFCEDIQKIEGYAEWKAYGGRKYNLDKDKLQEGLIHKVYSLSTCLFITNSENSTLSSLTGKEYKAIRLLDHHIEYFTNQKEFAIKYGLDTGNVNKCIKGAKPIYRGWKMEVISG